MKSETSTFRGYFLRERFFFNGQLEIFARIHHHDHACGVPQRPEGKAHAALEEIIS
jgi:hypothetical protein